MATTITKAQAKMMATDFLGTLGSTEDEFKPTESLSALFLLAGGLVTQAQDNLNKTDNVASGALSDSIKIMDPVQLGKTVRMDISALFYYKFVDQGVKGTKKGSGKYAFKNDGVGKKMMIAIRKWVIREGLKHKSDKYKAITKREAKRKSITDTSTSTAYAIAKSVKQKGIEPSGFFTDAVRSTQAAANEELGAALKIDIINTLPNGLNNKD